MNRQPIYNTLLSMGAVGERNAVKGKQLSMFYNCSERELRKDILSERCSGALICGSQHGYFIASYRSEIEDEYMRIYKRIATHNASMQAFKKALEEVEGQENMEI